MPKLHWTAAKRPAESGRGLPVDHGRAAPRANGVTRGQSPLFQPLMSVNALLGVVVIRTVGRDLGSIANW